MPSLHIHGARGSDPVAGVAFDRHGGQTTCFSMDGAGGTLIIDAGSGIRDLGETLNERQTPGDITILLTHLHLDHLLGLASFAPRYRPGGRITIMTDPAVHPAWQAALRRLVARPFWPVSLDDSQANIDMADLPSTAGQLTLYGIDIRWLPVAHPQGCLAYRLEQDGDVFVIATDLELGGPGDAGLRAFCRGCRHLVLDAQFTPEEYPSVREWGHSSWANAAHFAASAGVANLTLTHHDPGRTDDELDEIVRHAASIFPGTRAARAGLVLSGGVST